MVNEKCPVCGELNTGLHLEESNGWFECSKCGSTTKVLKKDETCVRIPIIAWEYLPKLIQKV